MISCTAKSSISFYLVRLFEQTYDGSWHMMLDTLMFLLTLSGKPEKGMADVLDFLGGLSPSPSQGLSQPSSLPGLGEMSQVLCARRESPEGQFLHPG